MAERRLTIYQRNTGRPIVLTDKMNVQSISDFKQRLIDMMKGEDKIVQFQTIDDLLIIRTDEIGGVMLSAEGEFKENIPTSVELAKIISEDSKKKSQVKPPQQVQNLVAGKANTINKKDFEHGTDKFDKCLTNVVLPEKKPVQPTEKSDYEQMLVIEESVEKVKTEAKKNE